METMNAPKTDDSTQTGTTRPRFRRVLCLFIDALILLAPAALLALFFIRPTALAAMTVIPTECWLVAGLSLQLLTLWAWRRRAWWVANAGWIAFAIFLIEPLISVPRALIPLHQPGTEEPSICIVSLNCWTGRQDVLNAIRDQQPDIVLLQESPGRQALEQWTKELFGENGAMLWGRDTSIIARGSLSPVETPPDAAFVHAIWQPREDFRCHVISLRLWPQPVRFDFWKQEYWQSFANVRTIHNQEMEIVTARVDAAISEALPVIVGGDFNNPAGDPAESTLPKRGLHDHFRQAGTGWGKTITDEFPFHRIDRIWTSPTIQPFEVIVVPNVGSDHRLVRSRATIQTESPEQIQN